MQIEIVRVALRETYTIGRLYINGKYICDTLEDAVRDVKIKHETAIPLGTYKVILTYSNRFKVVMPLLVDVENYSGVRIHWGKTPLHTSGCILVGYNTVKGQLTDTGRSAYYKVFNALSAAAIKGEDLTLTIKNK